MVLFAVAVIVCVFGYLERERSIFQFVYAGGSADSAESELSQLREMVAAGQDASTVRARSIEIARTNPGTRTELASYLFVASRWPDSAEAEMARGALLKLTDTTGIEVWERVLGETSFGPKASGELERWCPIAARLTERVRREPDHPRASRLLCGAAALIFPDTECYQAPPELVEIAKLIGEKYAAHAELSNFCEVVSSIGNPASWSRPFEPVVRQILAVNQDRFVRCSAEFALASIVRSCGAMRQDEARQCYVTFLANFDGKTEYHAQSVEQLYREIAQRELDSIATVGLGSAAPETSGVDLDGKALSLEEYRGRVVLISFWATWCKPCLQAIPHERALLEKFGTTEFSILGVNADDDEALAKDAVKQHGIAWRSLQKESHAKTWNVFGYPTFFVIDRDGVIRHTWLGLPSEAELETAIEALIHAKGDK